jgi:hypothetical protein
MLRHLALIAQSVVQPRLKPGEQLPVFRRLQGFQIEPTLVIATELLPKFPEEPVEQNLWRD